jgi:hypothetical protein
MVFVMYPQILTDAEYGFDQCGEEFTKVELRIKLLAVNTGDFWLASDLDVVPTGDKSYFFDDLVHPSVARSKVRKN